jgi:maltokinase
MIADDHIRELLEGRRWFAGDPAGAEVLEQSPLATDPQLTQVLVRGGDHVYQVVVDAEQREIDDNPNDARGLLKIVAPAEQVTSVRPMSAEQSNTSFIFDERIILKLFRKVGNGPNPDAEVPDALRRAGFMHVPEVLARWRGGDRDFATVQPFLMGANDGWSLALASLRQLFAEGTAPEEAGGDFGSEASRLGAVTAEMHLAMAKAFGSERADVQLIAKSVADGEMNTRLSTMDDAGALTRVHGDYHLGQVMRSDEAWYVVDFEGEPARPEHERLAANSPLKDVAGMVRSFDYASAVAAREQDEDVLSLARAWERHNRREFLESYWDAIHGSNLVPRSHKDAVALLEAFELEKALYEVAYERAHRPAWAEIPEAAVARLRVA